ncbi:hypothetical protein PYW07_004742 [Mythimna separata]|uniref:Fibronectin type III domain-containing protein n=1 Tax=Mythimna separata TaxID=271217 RepID=A0AAD8DY04_MYTSE|nr:hypothetical protein PYW07_004742 [Mythimna separata]
MSVEFLNLLRYEAKIDRETDSKSAGGHWLRRKEALRAKRGRRAPHKVRSRRQIDTITSITEEPDLADKSSTRRSQPHSSRISAGESEWSGATGGPPAEVVLRLHPPSSTSRVNASLADIDGSGVVVRAEEALIVAFVLLLWVAAIALFFNRWGKIRMLEPYQPKFQQQHRQSCALAENSVSVPPHQTAESECLNYNDIVSTEHHCHAAVCHTTAGHHSHLINHAGTCPIDRGRTRSS